MNTEDEPSERPSTAAALVLCFSQSVGQPRYCRLQSSRTLQHRGIVKSWQTMKVAGAPCSTSLCLCHSTHYADHWPRDRSLVYIYRLPSEVRIPGCRRPRNVDICAGVGTDSRSLDEYTHNLDAKLSRLWRRSNGTIKVLRVTSLSRQWSSTRLHWLASIIYGELLSSIVGVVGNVKGMPRHPPCIEPKIGSCACL